MKTLAFLSGVVVTCALIISGKLWVCPPTRSAVTTIGGTPIVPEPQVWTLYRTSPFGNDLKVHAGTFYLDDGSGLGKMVFRDWCFVGISSFQEALDLFRTY